MYTIHYDYLGYEECKTITEVARFVQSALLDGTYHIEIDEEEEE